MSITNKKEHSIGFVVCPTEKLKKVCMDNDFLRHATIAQCSKIFETNCIEISLKEGHYASLYAVISMIWLCSDQDYNTIVRILIDVNNEYLISISDIFRSPILLKCLVDVLQFTITVRKTFPMIGNR